MRILVVFAVMLMSCNPKAQDSVTKSQEDLKTEFLLPKKAERSFRNCSFSRPENHLGN